MISQSSIESRFLSLRNESPQSALLVAQWEFDRNLVGDALSNIGTVFPHYSLHDRSHSNTILLRIDQILGDDGVAALGATDLWLLLEAAYSHDLGMHVTHVRRRADIADPKFRAHVERLCSSSDAVLCASAKRLLSVSIGEIAEVYDAHQDLIIVYAEFVRPSHHQRSAQAVLDPRIHAGVDSPRTRLIPTRLFRAVSEICSAHGSSRENLFKLSAEESGAGKDRCHPRLVACLLRLGDLLDLDSGRFCPAMGATIGNVPDTSKAHQGKHAGITRLNVTPRRVDVEGEYDEIEEYAQAESWLSSLRDELVFQNMRWPELCSVESISSPPGIGVIAARLKDQILVGDSRPHLEVDRTRVLGLLQGRNIYNGCQDAVRELIQNAVDASLLRLASEIAGGLEHPKDPTALRELLRRRPIRVSFVREGSDGKKARWRLTVEDQGIGLRRDDLQYLLRLASSGRSDYKAALVKVLAEWAQPSGNFGIGFHAVLQYAKSVSVLSRNALSPVAFEVDFSASSLGRPLYEDPRVVVKERSVAQDSVVPLLLGTTVKVVIEFDAVPRWVSLGDDSEVARVASQFDPICDDELLVEPMLVKSVIRQLQAASLVQIDFVDHPNQEFGFPSNSYFDEESGLEIALLETGLGHRRSDFMYRGVPVEHVFSPVGLSVAVNVHSGKARDLLDLSRNKFTRAGKATVHSATLSSVSRAALAWRQSQPESALWFDLYRLLSGEVSGDAWRNVEIPACESAPGKCCLLGALAECDDLLLSVDRSLASPPEEFWRDPPAQFRQSGTCGELRFSDASDLRGGWLTSFLRRIFNWRRIELVRNELAYRFRRSGEVFEDIEQNAHSLVLFDAVNSEAFVGSRVLLERPHEFVGLETRLREGPMWLRRAPSVLQNRIVSPFVVEDGPRDVAGRRQPRARFADLERYVNWLAKDRGEDVRTVAALVSKYIGQLPDALFPSAERDDAQLTLTGMQR